MPEKKQQVIHWRFLTCYQKENGNSTSLCHIPAMKTELIWACCTSSGREVRRGQPRFTWTGAVEKGPTTMKFGLHRAWRKIKDREVWHQPSLPPQED